MVRVESRGRLGNHIPQDSAKHLKLSSIKRGIFRREKNTRENLKFYHETATNSLVELSGGKKTKCCAYPYRWPWNGRYFGTLIVSSIHYIQFVNINSMNKFNFEHSSNCYLIASYTLFLRNYLVRIIVWEFRPYNQVGVSQGSMFSCFLWGIRNAEMRLSIRPITG